MQRKPGFPVGNCSIKMPDNMGLPSVESFHGEDDPEQQQRRQQLINFGHSQWGFNNWSWTVTKQELDFVDFTNGKYCAGVVAFVSITVKSFDIHRENIGYATSLATNKGFAIYKSRKGAVTNALRETLLSFGGSVANDLLELADAAPAPAPPAPADENNQNAPNKPPPAEPKNAPLNRRAKDEPANPRPPPPALKNVPPNPPPVPPAHAPALPPANRPAPRAPPPPAPAAVPLRPNSNEAACAGAGDTDEEARAERKRRQRQAQEEFRQRQLAKQKGLDEKQELHKNCTSFDKLLMELPSQDIEIQETGDSATEAKRKSPGEGGAAKRRASVINRLDIVEAD